VNVDGLLNVLEVSRLNKVKRVIFAASSSAYGNNENLPLREDFPASPLSPYGAHKYVGEIYCKVWAEVYKLETVCLRYFNVYGPRFNPEGAYPLVIGLFLKNLQLNKPLTITGDGTQTRDFTHVKDVVKANLLAMKSNKIGMGEVINIGGGHRHTINDIAKLVGGNIEYIAPRLEPHDTEADISKAKELLGWEPVVKIEDGVAELKKIFGV
jgi:UDP-glucose 4-epimerase